MLVRALTSSNACRSGGWGKGTMQLTTRHKEGAWAWKGMVLLKPGSEGMHRFSCSAAAA